MSHVKINLITLFYYKLTFMGFKITVGGSF